MEDGTHMLRNVTLWFIAVVVVLGILNSKQLSMKKQAEAAELAKIVESAKAEQHKLEQALELKVRENKDDLQQLLTEYPNQKIYMLKFFNTTKATSESVTDGTLNFRIYRGNIHDLFKLTPIASRKVNGELTLKNYTETANGFFDFVYCVDVKYLSGGVLSYKTAHEITNYIDSEIVQTQLITNDFLDIFDLKYLNQ